MTAQGDGARDQHWSLDTRNIMLQVRQQISCSGTPAGPTAEECLRETRAAWKMSYPDRRDGVELKLENLTLEVKRELRVPGSTRKRNRSWTPY